MESDFISDFLPKDHFMLNDKDATTTAFDFENKFNKIAILNSADFLVPGGTFIDGSHAQEECLCHESDLYPVLYSFDKTYYSNNRKSNKGYMFESRALFTPDIVFERIVGNETKVLKKVLEILDMNCNVLASEIRDAPNEITVVNSTYDPSFLYELGYVVEVEDFDDNRWHECSTGIHFFLTFNEAKCYDWSYEGIRDRELESRVRE